MNILRLSLMAIAVSATFTSCKKSETSSPASKPVIKAGVRALGVVLCEADTTKEGFKITNGGQAGGIAVDGGGNVFTTGVSSAGMYIQKFSANGALAWTNTMVPVTMGENGYSFGSYAESGGAGYYSLPTLTTDKSGNVYALYTRSDFFQLLTKNGWYENIIVSKYSGSGTLLGTLAQPVGKLNGPGFDSIKTVAAMRLDVDGNVYLCGNYDTGALSPASINFDPHGTHMLTGRGAFILKMTTGGNFAGLVKINAELDYIALGSNGYVYDTGLPAAGGSGYVRAFGANGSQLWNKSLPGYTPDFITADVNGNAIISEDGQYMGKRSANGSLLWHKSALPQSLPGPGTSYAITGDIVMTTDENANIYIASDYFYVNSSRGTPFAQSFLYIQKYDAGGNLLGARHKEYGINTTTAAALISDDSSYLYTSGSLILATGPSKIPMPVTYTGAYDARISQCF